MKEDDAISRQAAIDIVNNPMEIRLDLALSRLPSVTPKQRTGHWKRISMDKYVQHAQYYYRCSECGEDIIGEHNYCPNCGAKMVELQESEVSDADSD